MKTTVGKLRGVAAGDSFSLVQLVDAWVSMGFILGFIAIIYRKPWFIWGLYGVYMGLYGFINVYNQNLNGLV